VPFGGAYFILMFVEHMVHAWQKHVMGIEHDPANDAGHVHIVNVYTLGLLGCFIIMLYSPTFRAGCGEILRACGRLFVDLFVAWPKLILQSALARQFMRTPIYRALQQYFFKPFVSTVVPGGETWCLDGVEFEAPIASLPVSDRTQPTCVADGTGNIVGDNVANFSLTDCNGRRVKLHATCNDPAQKALWIIGTAGWCTACHEFLSGFVADHGGYLSRQKVGEVSKGLDMLIVLGEDSNGAKPTQAYCKAYAEELSIDPAMVLIDWSDSPVPVNIVNVPDMQVETNALGTLWTAMDPYLYEEGGSVATYYPWWALLRPRNMEYVWSDRAALQSFEATLLGLLAED